MSKLGDKFAALEQRNRERGYMIGLEAYNDALGLAPPDTPMDPESDDEAWPEVTAPKHRPDWPDIAMTVCAYALPLLAVVAVVYAMAQTP